MIDNQDFMPLVEVTTDELKDNLQRLEGDAKLNYLLFVRDEVNRLLKANK